MLLDMSPWWPSMFLLWYINFGWGPVVWTYCSVSFTLPAARMRSLQMGMATASQWLFNFVVAKVTSQYVRYTRG